MSPLDTPAPLRENHDHSPEAKPIPKETRRDPDVHAPSFAEDELYDGLWFPVTD